MGRSLQEIAEEMLEDPLKWARLYLIEKRQSVMLEGFLTSQGVSPTLINSLKQELTEKIDKEN